MYFYLSDSLTRKFIFELRQFWQHHPKFRDLVDNIQGKYSFKERPQRGIIVKTGGGSHVSLAPDHYKGMVLSYCYLAKAVGKPGLAVEWVREDGRAIQANGGVFPSPPGVYYIDIVSGSQYGLDTEMGFFVDPLLDVRAEQVTSVDATTYQFQNAPVAGTTRIFEMPAGFLFHEGTNYTLTLDGEGKPTGEVILTAALDGGRWLQADYRYSATSTGPFPLVEQHANNQAIPGVVMAFGRRVEVGDQLGVVVQAARYPSALEYGGRWAMSVEFEVMARDVYDQREILDWSVMALYAVARGRLSSEGIEILTVSLGGESEEVYDETGDDYFYNGSFSIDLETEWSIHVPLNLWLRQVAPLTNAEAKILAGLPEDQLPGKDGNIKALADIGLENVRDPFWTGNRGTFESIK
jgi:hypothetical protein